MASDSESDFVIKRFGEVLDLGICLVGKNLNLIEFRGFATLDALACASAPDVYDMIKNPQGTQRDLKPKHAEDCFGYAIESAAQEPTEHPCAFPEVLINVRDTNVVELYNVEDPSETIDLDSFSEVPDYPVVGVRIRLTEIEFPKKLIGPQISRVDGNHRLHKAGALLSVAADDGEEVDYDFPVIPFAMLIALETTPEARLFRDINGTPIKMETAHLDTIEIKTGDNNALAEKNLPLFLANQLAQPNRAFHNKIFYGGSSEGVKAELGSVPPLRINSLRTTVKLQLALAPVSAERFVKRNPEALLELMDRYWKAVAAVWPEAWANKRDYILLQSIGLTGFARLGGALMDRGLALKDVSEEYFIKTLKVVRDAVPLDRDDPRWAGVAGAGGGAEVAGQLIAAADSEEAGLIGVEEDLAGAQPGIPEKLDSALVADDSEESLPGNDGAE